MSKILPALITIDLDGTLIDSVGDLHKAVANMQIAMGESASPESAVRDWVGNGIERLVHRALTCSMDGTATPEFFEQGLQRFRLEYQKVNGKHSTVYSTVPETLQWLQDQGIPLTCVTNKARAFTLPLLETHKLSPFFSDVIAGDDITSKKPDPEALLSAANLKNVNPSDCLMLGDSVSDVKAAQAAGYSFIGVSYGYNHGQSLRELVTAENHRAIIDSFAELRTIIG